MILKTYWGWKHKSLFFGDSYFEQYVYRCNTSWKLRYKNSHKFIVFSMYYKLVEKLLHVRDVEYFKLWKDL
jgi:hypothetical protein